MLVEKIQRLLEQDVEVIIASTASLDLIWCYSTLYQNGQAVRSCAESQRRYYAILSKEGLTKAKEMENLKKRTCKPNWGDGLVWVNRCARHFLAEHITDEQATDLLIHGDLPESMFDVLPDDYLFLKEEKPAKETTEQPEEVKKKGRKPKN